MARGLKTTISLNLAPADLSILESWQRSTSIPSGLAKRARIMLLVAKGTSISDTARTVGIQRKFVYKWVQRYQDEGINGLYDKLRPGRPSRRASADPMTAGG